MRKPKQPVEWLHAFTNKSLHLILFITEKCNFRCVYCYEDFKLGKIEEDVIVGIKNLINSRIQNLDTLIVSFFGGEPLMNKKVTMEISEWAKNLSLKYNVSYEGAITTNGWYLKRELFEEMLLKGISTYQITLDGDKDNHNDTRLTTKGLPTFDVIMSNVLNIAKSNHKFQCTIRLNISDQSLESAKKFIYNYFKYFAGDKRFFFDFHPIFGMPNLRLTLMSKVKELEALAREYDLNIEDISSDNICYASKPDSFVIRANGRIQKCTITLNDNLNNIGWLHKDGSMDIDQKKLKKWVFAENKGCPVKDFDTKKILDEFYNTTSDNKIEKEKVVF